MFGRDDVPPPVSPAALGDDPTDHAALGADPTDDPTDDEELDVRAAELVEGGIGLARLAVGSAWRTSRWYVSTSMSIAERVVGALASGESVTHAANEAASGARDALLELVGVGDGPDDDEDRPRRRRAEHLDAAELRRRGAELLRQSSDVTWEEDTHPAYARILESLSPDEARILRLIELEGPQPSVDVRTSSAVPNNSQLVTAGLTMIGGLAGCRYVDRTPMYLNNLHRLGLVRLSHEPLRDPDTYQVLEAQPDVIAAVESAKRGRTTRRSIHMTPFGHDFVRLCLQVQPPSQVPNPPEI
jgi:hypothetical protein